MKKYISRLGAQVVKVGTTYEPMIVYVNAITRIHDSLTFLGTT